MAVEMSRWPSGQSVPIVGLSAWREAISSGFLPLEVGVECPRDFVGSIDGRNLGPVARAALVNSSAHEVRRTAELAGKSERNQLKALWLAHGRCEVEQGANRSVLEGGQWAVYETGRPYAIRFADGARFAVALLPIELCPEWAGIHQQLCARALEVDAASRGALFTLLSAFESAGNASLAGFDAVGRAMSMMVAESLRLQAATLLPVDRPERRLRDVRRLVEARLADPTLNPQDLADGLHLSLRAVYSLFSQMDTTPMAFIQAERLERARRDLADTTRTSRTITEIALDNGFADSAHFSRLFKARFGITASAWRARPA